MFPADKPLPPPPLPEKPSLSKSKENASEASASGTAVRPRPTSGAFGSGKLAFNTAKAIFDTVKKPEVQRGLIAIGKNETVRSTTVSVAKNERARTAVLNALQDERTLKTVSNVAQAYDRQQQQKDLINLDHPVAGGAVSGSNYGISEFGTRKANEPSLYPSLPSSRDYAPFKDSTSTTSFAAIHNQLASLNLYQPAFVKKAPPRPAPPKLHHSAIQHLNGLTGLSQQEQPYGYAKFQFVASHFDELSVERNDLVELEKQVDDQWVYGLNKRTSQKGIVPLVYLDVKVPLPVVFSTSTPQVPFYARALFDFNSGVQGDLAFRANDEICVTERINNDWMRGTIGMREGIFPANHVQETTSPAATTAAPEPAPVNWNAIPEHVTAAYDYNSGVDGDLVFRTDDRIEVVEWVSRDWLRGKLRGQIGLVPRTYLRTVDNNGSTANIGKQPGSHIVGTVVTATKDYYNVASDHLCFSKGDQIEVLEEVNSSWLKGKLLLNMSNAKSFPLGLFPRSAIL